MQNTHTFTLHSSEGAAYALQPKSTVKSVFNATSTGLIPIPPNNKSIFLFYSSIVKFVKFVENDYYYKRKCFCYS